MNFLKTTKKLNKFIIGIMLGGSLISFGISAAVADNAVSFASSNSDADSSYYTNTRDSSGYSSQSLQDETDGQDPFASDWSSSTSSQSFTSEVKSCDDYQDSLNTKNDYCAKV